MSVVTPTVESGELLSSGIQSRCIARKRDRALPWTLLDTRKEKLKRSQTGSETSEESHESRTEKTSILLSVSLTRSRHHPLDVLDTQFRRDGGHKQLLQNNLVPGIKRITDTDEKTMQPSQLSNVVPGAGRFGF